MPLPAAGTTWPPKELDPVTSQLRVWSAWYSSDLDELSGVYGGTIAGDPANPPGIDPLRNDWRARVARTFARWFWGTQVPDGERRTKLHVPLARDIAATSADLLFGVPPSITLPDGSDQAAQDRLDKLAGLGLRAALTEAAELAGGLGGIYLRIVWHKPLRDRPWISAVHADGAVPDWRWNILTGVTFYREVAVDGSKVFRHLERHEPGHVLHGLYQGSRTDLGKVLPLDAHPSTKGLAEVVPTGLDRLTATYIPNVRPAPSWRRVPAAANLGRADFDGVEPLMDALDEAYSSLMRDIRLGRARLHVPDTYLQSLGPGNGTMFEDREMYTGVPMMGGGLDQSLANMIQETQFEIRVEPHLRTCLDLMERIVAASGYSAQTFGLQGDGGLQTATEVDAKKDRSAATRAKKTTYWTPELGELLLTALMIDKTVFKTGITIPDAIDVDFGDGVIESPRQVAETVKLLADAEAASIETRVRMVHPEWEKERVDAEVEGIRADGGMMTDPIDRMSGIGNEPDPQAEDDDPPPPVPFGQPAEDE